MINSLSVSAARKEEKTTWSATNAKSQCARSAVSSELKIYNNP